MIFASRAVYRYVCIDFIKIYLFAYCGGLLAVFGYDLCLGKSFANSAHELIGFVAFTCQQNNISLS